MLKNLFLKTIYDIFYLFFLLDRSFSKKFLKFNNWRVGKFIKKNRGKITKVSILLPHCIQKYTCPIKVTSEISNCKECGQCRIGDFVQLQREYDVHVKIATGGTLARTYLKKQRPQIVIAVACERDLVSGIKDAFPMKVYGIFNEIKNMPCMDTDVSMTKVREVLNSMR